MAEHLNQWLNGYVAINCSQRTLDGYQTIIERHLIPALGHVQLKRLDYQAIERYYGKAREIPLSPRTVHHQHRVLSEALKYACRHGIIAHNPCELIDIKGSLKQIKRKMRTLIPAEVEVVLETASGTQYYPVYYTAVSTGLRQAELLDLTWRDIDLDFPSISVRQVLYIRKGVYQLKEPKTEHSRRRVDMTPKLACFLREYRAERESLYRSLGKELTLNDLVFASVEGKPIDGRVMSHAFGRMVKKVNLAGVRFHDLRHTFASLMLQRGAKPKVISEALGHSSVAFTMDVYSHIIEGMQANAMTLLDGCYRPVYQQITQKVRNFQVLCLVIHRFRS